MSFYKTLGVAKNSTQSQIKSAFYKLSKIYHPDRNNGSQEAARRFRDIAAAYEILGNPKRREAYDGQDAKVHYKFRKAETKSNATNEWMRQRYSKEFRKEQQYKQQKVNESADEKIDRQNKSVTFGFFVVLLVSWYY